MCEMAFSELTDAWRGEEPRWSTFRRIRPLASRWEPGRCNSTGTEVILLLPAVTVDSFLLGSALRDGCTHDLRLRFVVTQGVAASLWPAVAVAENSAEKTAIEAPGSILRGAVTVPASSLRRAKPSDHRCCKFWRGRQTWSAHRWRDHPSFVFRCSSTR